MLDRASCRLEEALECVGILLCMLRLCAEVRGERESCGATARTRLQVHLRAQHALSAVICRDGRMARCVVCVLVCAERDSPGVLCDIEGTPVSRSPCRIGSAECTGYSCMTMSRYVSIVDKQGRGRLAETDTPHESRQRYTTSDVRLTYSQFGILSIAIVFIDRPHRAHRPLKGDTRQTGTSERGRASPDKLHSRTQCSGRSGLFSL